jgi:hypothetical protein
MPISPSANTILPIGSLCMESTRPLVMVSAEIEPTSGQMSGGRIW